MPTPAFPNSILTKIRAGKQANRFRATLGQVYEFRAFCCNINSDGIMGVSKQPICDLSLTPNPVCLGDAVNFNLTGSYAPGSAIVQYAIDMGDYTSYNVASGSHTYAAVGTYAVTATVTEGLGKYQTATAQVIVVDCSHPMLMTYTYASTFGYGVYYIDWTAAVPAWEAKNTGLTGTALNVNSMIMNPATKHLPAESQELWIATQGGVFRTFNGGISWSKLNISDPDNTDFAIVPAPTADQLNYICVRMSKVDPDVIYILAALSSPAHTWMFRSSDIGVTFTSKGIM